MVGNSWVTVGGPVGPEARELEVIERFVEEARRQGKRVRFFCVERDLSQTSSLAAVHIGDQPIWDPSIWPQNLSKKLREQLRRARGKGLVTTRLASSEEISDCDHPTRRGADAVLHRWLDARKLAPMGYLIELDPFARVHERRVFVAEHGGEIVGLMVALPIYGRKGWFIDNMMRTPDAPNGTVELLTDCAMRTLAAEGSQHVTLGLSPFVGVTSPLIQFIRDSTGRFYNFKGLYAFKTKLRPASWQPLYLAYPKHERGASAVFDSITAFLPGGWARFLWNSAIQRARLGAGLCASVVLFWTIMLAFANTEHWFPSRAVHAGWFALHLATLGSLCALALRWRRWLAIAVTGLAVTQLGLGALQLVGYNAARAHGSDWLVLALSMAGLVPTAALMWAARNRQRLYAASRQAYAQRLPAAGAASATVARAVKRPARVSDALAVRADPQQEI